MKADTIPRQFLHAAAHFNKRDAFRHKIEGRYVDVSHEEVVDRVHKAALGLHALHLVKQDRIAILSENRLEWAIADLATLSAGCITVPVYATIPANQVEYILGNSEARAVFVSDTVQLEKILACRNNLPTLQHIIAFDPDCDVDGVITLDALIQRGELVPDKPSLPEMASTIGKYDWASVIYTSGTTGEPKGVILTHWNFMSNVHALLEVISIGPDDRYLSFLPLSHVFERTAGYYLMLTAGATIAYAQGTDTVAEDMIEVSPTIMCSVPRLYEKIYAQVMENVEKSSGMRQNLFHWAVKVGRQYLEEAKEGDTGFLTRRKRALADRLVFKKLKARTGGRLRFFVSGGAPLSPELNEFFHAAGIPILEGYGLTETSPVLAVNTLEHLKLGTVGRPVPGVQLEIAEDGEILARGDSVTQGYYKKPEQTRAALVDGWFHTGDVGRIDEDGYLRITDRKKDVIVTAGGKNVAPQPIESRLKTSKYIAEAILVGNRRRFVAAIIVPDFAQLEEFALSRHIPHNTREQLVEATQVNDLYTAEIERLCEPFASFERVKRFVLLDHELEIARGELTPSLKVRRVVIEDKYRNLIDGLYEG
jgi:long-chain acyl-CoA synthetase